MARGSSQVLAGVVAAVLGAAPVAANDSVAGLALGGLQFLTTDAVEMVEEVLHITPDRVQVRYVFRNGTKAPVETLVAFPLPPLGFPDDFAWVQIPHEDSANYVGFVTRIDGVTITPNVATRASLLGIDVTDRLDALGVPPIPFAWDADARIAALPAATRQALRAALLIDAANRPLWTLETSFWRRQTFPPGVEVVVEHSYRPVIGGSSVAPFGNGDRIDPGDDRAAAARRQYCVDPDVETAMIRARLDGAAPGDRHFSSSDIGYVLTTGANWHGPIGRFRLIVEAPDPRDFVFLCLDEARRIAPNRIEAELNGFRPWHDLDILFAHLWGDDIGRGD